MECRICGNTKNHTIYSVREMMMGLRDIFTYFQCEGCKCLQISEIPIDIAKYYSDNYYSFEERESDNFFTRIMKQERDNYALFNSSLIGKMLYANFPKQDLRSLSKLNLKKNTKILDVGCGTGELLRSLYKLGFKKVTGIDPFNKKEIIKIDGNAKIFKKSIQELRGQWDLIMFHHVFEHMPDPLQVLQSVSKLLSPGGHCIIRIPVTESLAWKKYREDWIQLDPPRHYFVHSPESIRYLVSQTDLKFRKVDYDSTSFQFWGSIQYQNDIPLRHESSYAVNQEKSIFTKNDIEAFARKAKNLNMKQKGDQAVFILQKEEKTD